MEKLKNSRSFPIHFAVLLFGMAGLFGKLVELPAMTITLGRVGFSSLALLLYLLGTRQSLRLHSPIRLLRLILAGVLLAFHWSVFYYSIQLSSVAIGLLSSATFPVFTMFLEPLFFREPFRPRNAVYALVALAGVLLISPSLRSDNANLQGVLWGIVAGASYAVLTMLNRVHMRWGYPSAVVTFYEQATAAVALFPISLLTASASPNARDLLLLAVLGIAFTAFAHTVFIGGLKRVTAHTAGLISCMEPVYGTIFAALFLREIPAAREIAGGILILAVAVLQSIPPRKRNFSDQ